MCAGDSDSGAPLTGQDRTAAPRCAAASGGRAMSTLALALAEALGELCCAAWL